jgi:hypothetical protein
MLPSFYGYEGSAVGGGEAMTRVWTVLTWASALGRRISLAALQARRW